MILFCANSADAAVGCTLNDPDRDVKRLFPRATNYKTEFFTIKDNGGEKLAKQIEAKLGDKLDPVYEALDVPYAYYTILQGKKVTGYIHGVNQKATYGGMQMILSTDANGVISDFYYQKMISPDSKKFKDKKFTGQFTGLSLADFYTKDMTQQVENPSPENVDDYLPTLRGLRKNLILHDQFKLNNKYDRYFYKNKEQK